MKTKKDLTTTLFMLLLATAYTSMVNAQTKSDALLGEWLSEKKDSRFLIYKQDNKYYGKIVWGTGSDTKDSKNPNLKLRNRELIGLTILYDFVFDGEDTWEDGTIYDPREGKTYACKINMKSENELNVRGYFGISMFGRTEVWTRVNK
jgi:uncharacterized protein (DUF2147 family)